MDLEDTMASLQLNEEHSSDEEEVVAEPRRSSRLKSRITYTEKRRVFTKPTKICKDDSFKDIDNYYLDKRIKRLSPTLETIYEDKSDDKKKSTIKKRKMKAKSASAPHRVSTRQKLPLNYLLEKLKEIDK